MFKVKMLPEHVDACRLSYVGDCVSGHCIQNSVAVVLICNKFSVALYLYIILHTDSVTK